MKTEMTIQAIYALRMVIAGICGIIIGFERKNRSKEAGIRTHCVVACAAALMMIVSKYAYGDVTYSFTKLDPSRVASGVVQGVGFLGAGMIFVHRSTIKGLTTAAGIWATSGIGLAIGSGLYFVGIFATFLIILIQIVLHANMRWLKMPKVKTLVIKHTKEKDFLNTALKKLKGKNIMVFDTAIETNPDDETKNYEFTIEIPTNINEDNIVDMFDYKCTLRSNS